MDFTSHNRPPLFQDLTPKSLARLNPDWIDLDTLKAWLQTCDNSHGADCGHRHSLDPRAGLQNSRSLRIESSGSKSPKSNIFHRRFWSHLSKSQGDPSAINLGTTTPNFTPNETAGQSQTLTRNAPVNIHLGHGRPQWLICVQRGCLVKAGPQDQYAALSYV
jgi:hypothetical protein